MAWLMMRKIFLKIISFEIIFDARGKMKLFVRRKFIKMLIVVRTDRHDRLFLHVFLMKFQAVIVKLSGECIASEGARGTNSCFRNIYKKFVLQGFAADKNWEMITAAICKSEIGVDIFTPDF